ncbi:hypothetical protein HanIR_Chr08g0373331 [Helianthus annuus]|nr:hypothetical protein HanIR_Chr08g0373331 [Helianthus annuus]
MLEGKNNDLFVEVAHHCHLLISKSFEKKISEVGIGVFLSFYQKRLDFYAISRIL